MRGLSLNQIEIDTPSVALALSDHVFEASPGTYQTLGGRRISRDGCPGIGGVSERVVPTSSPMSERTGEYAPYRPDRVPLLEGSEVDLLLSYSCNVIVPLSEGSRPGPPSHAGICTGSYVS